MFWPNKRKIDFSWLSSDSRHSEKITLKLLTVILGVCSEFYNLLIWPPKCRKSHLLKPKISVIFIFQGACPRTPLRTQPFGPRTLPFGCIISHLYKYFSRLFKNLLRTLRVAFSGSALWIPFKIKKVLKNLN